MIKMDLISGSFKLCPMFNNSKFGTLWFNPNPLTQPHNWDVFYRGEWAEAEKKIREAVAEAVKALKPPPEPESFTELMFYSKHAAHSMCDALKELNELAEGSTDYNGIRDQWEDILDSHVQCRHRYCGTCNGVGCEYSHLIEIPNSLLDATRDQRDRAGDAEPTPAQLRAWQYDDEGRCHW